MLWVLHIVEVKHEVRQIHLKISYGSAGKESACSEGDLGSIPRLGRSPGGRHGNPLLENPHGQRSLVDYSSWDCKELDTTEGLTLLLHRTEDAF